MNEFIARLERMQRVQDRHVQRVAGRIRSIAAYGGTIASDDTMARLVEDLQRQEELRLDPAARALARIMLRSGLEAQGVCDNLVTIVSVMSVRIDAGSVHQVEEAARSGFAVMVIADDVEFVARLTDCGKDLQALRVIAQFLTALKAWLLVVERLIERVTTRTAMVRPSSRHSNLSRLSSHPAPHYPARQAITGPSPRKPQEPHRPGHE